VSGGRPDGAALTDPQLSLDTVWICDACTGSCVEVDPETLLERSCRLCHGEGMLDHEPPPGRDPFEGMETQ
jgi:hypothetical protein